MVAVGIGEIDGVRNFVVLEFEFDAVLFKLLLRCNKTIAIGAEGEMKHSDVAAR